MKTQHLFPFMYRGYAKSLDETTLSGYYTVSPPSSTDIPEGSYNYGVLLVYGDTFIVQLYIPHADYSGDKYGVRIRVKHNDTWNKWEFLKYES